MNPPRSNRAITAALWANAALLLAILVALLSRSNGSVLPSAFGQTQPPIAGGGGVFVMPGQTATNMWGAYLLDIDNQTLCVYQYFPGEKQLKLSAARDYKWDRRLHNFNTPNPSPNEVKAMIEKEAAGLNNGGVVPAGRTDPKAGS